MGFWDDVSRAIGLDKTETSDTASAQGNLDDYTWGKLGENSLARKEYDKRAAMEAQALARGDTSYGQSQEARGQSQQAREQQARLLGEYQQMASGKGPSLAREQLATGLGQAQAQATQTAASARGGGANALLANRAAQQQGSQAALTTNQQAAEVRSREQLGAMEAQGLLASNMRQGDLATRQGDLATRGQDFDHANAQMGAQMHIADASQQGKIAAKQAYNQAVQFDADQKYRADESYRQRRQQFAAGIVRGASSGGASLVTG